MEKVIKASFDRVEGDFAVVYADEASAADHKHHYRFNVPLELVKNAKPGARLQLHIENDRINHIEIDREATEKARDRIRKKYERLQRARHLREQ